MSTTQNKFVTMSGGEFVRDALLEVVPFCTVKLEKDLGRDSHKLWFVLSLTPRSEWPGTYIENTPHARFHISPDGRVEIFTWNLSQGQWQAFRDGKFRRLGKFKGKDLPAIVRRLKTHIENVIRFRGEVTR